MPQSYSAVHVHLVFSTFERRPLLHDHGIRDEMHRVLGSLSGHLGCPTVVVGGVADHVHVLASLGREVSQSDWAKELKRQSTGWAKAKVPEFRWQGGFGAFSVGRSELPVVRPYIERQEEHHRTVSFEEEFLALLKEHGVEFDEKYLWRP